MSCELNLCLYRTFRATRYIDVQKNVYFLRHSLSDKYCYRGTQLRNSIENVMAIWVMKPTVGKRRYLYYAFIYTYITDKTPNKK